MPWVFRLFFFWLFGENFVDMNDIHSHPNWRHFDVETCGLTRFNTKQRIINGEQAGLGQFPWIARMGKQRHGYIFFDCGGSLINQYYVISAAHCGDDHDVVRLGENIINVGKDCDDTKCAPPVQDIKIQYNLQFGYNETTHHNDLMLTRLKFPAQLNEFVWPVCLPYGPLLTKDLVGSRVQIAGWGYIDRIQVNLPNHLMYFNAPVVEPQICNDIYKKPLDPEIQYCVGYSKEESKDSCAGDSGGPMTRYENVDGIRKHFLMGVVSYGLKRCGDGPAVYTKLVHYLPQVLDLIE